MTSFKSGVHIAGSDALKVGLIGCGGRGTGAAHDCVNSSPGVEIYAMGDLFKDRLDSSRANLKGLGAKLTVTDDRCFVGFDAYLRVLDSGVDSVILATPPGFRPRHIRAAVRAGKHVFAEKPVAVCPAGVRSVIESGGLAHLQRVSFVAGTQYRHHVGYQDIISKIHAGAIGKVEAAEAYYLTGSLWNHGRKPEWSDAEWQIRNWYYFCWLSGDHIVEQFVHNMDVINWAMQSHPLKAVGTGGRQVRTSPAYGHIYDHFAVEYEYPGGVKCQAMARQIDGCASSVQNRIAGNKGEAYTNGLDELSGWITTRRGRYEHKQQFNPYTQEHADMIAGIRSGNLLNEATQVAESTLSAIMGRMAAYTGQEVTWEQAVNSKLDLRKEHVAFGPMEVPPVPMPGKTPLI